MSTTSFGDEPIITLINLNEQNSYIEFPKHLERAYSVDTVLPGEKLYPLVYEYAHLHFENNKAE